MSDINAAFNDINIYKNDLFQKLKSDVLHSIVSELQNDFDNYIADLEKLPTQQKELLIEKYNLSSLNKLNITSEDIDGKIVISSDRVRDARILEYIYGKKTPIQSILSKICSESSMMSLLRKWSK